MANRTSSIGREPAAPMLLAAMSDPRDDDSDDTTGQKALRGLGGLAAQSLAPLPALGAMKLVSGLDPKGASPQQVTRAMGSPVKHFVPGEPAMGFGTVQGKEVPVIFHKPDTGEGVLAHEAGHSLNAKAQGLRGYKATQLGSRGVAGLTGAAAAIYSAAATDPSWVPALAHLAVSSPGLLDEMAASARATAYLTKHHGAAGGFRRAVPLLPAFGTYAAAAATPLAITAWRKHRAKRNAEEQGKEAALAALGLH